MIFIFKIQSHIENRKYDVKRFVGALGILNTFNTYCKVLNNIMDQRCFKQY